MRKKKGVSTNNDPRRCKLVIVGVVGLSAGLILGKLWTEAVQRKRQMVTAFEEDREAEREKIQKSSDPSP